MVMNLYNFLAALKRQKPLLGIQGDIFFTPANHIAFGVHYPDKSGNYDNNNGGFSSLVVDYGWTDLGITEFKKGIPESRMIKGKMFHALPIHSAEDGGWKDAPKLIEECLNRLPVSNDDVIACVLFGGGHAGKKYKASANNIEGIIRSYKSTVLYVNNEAMYELLAMHGVVARSLPYSIPLAGMPTPVLYKDRDAYLQLLEKAGVYEEEIN